MPAAVRVHVILPGPPETPTGGFAYDRHMLAALRRDGRLAEAMVIAGDYPFPAAATLAAAGRRLALLPDGAVVVVDGLALTPLLPAFASHAPRLRLLALVHHPLADETGLPPVCSDRLFEDERQALALTRGVIVTSRKTAQRLADFAVPGDRIRVVRPGVATPRGGRRHTRSPTPSPTPAPSPVRSLLCVGSLVPRKGQDVLLRALSRLKHRGWRLRLVGPARDRAYAGRLHRLTRALRLQARVAFEGAVSEARLERHYRSADAFIFPSHHEGYGIAVAEAAARGLPIVASDAGAIAEAVAGARATLVPPGNPLLLAAALRPLLTRHGPRVRRPAAGSAATRTWEQAGREFLAALDQLSADR